MKKSLKIILKYFVIYIILTMFFFLAMIGTYLLPNNRIRNNVIASIPILQGDSAINYFQTDAATLDNHTDSLILNIAMNKGEHNDIMNAFENSFYEDETQQGLSSLIEGTQKEVNNHEYSRYWHGIQTIIRPLLVFFNYAEIRYIFMITVIVLMGITFAMIGKQLNIKNAIGFAIAISYMYVILIPVSLQYSPMFIVTLLSMITVLMLYKYNKEKYISNIFFIIGAFATFFDLLTYPLVTLGFPIILTLILEDRKGTNLKKQMLLIIKLGILWGLGYGILFFTKWVIASIVLNKDAITLALDQILFRVNGNEQYPVDRIGAIKVNFEYFYIPVAKFIFILTTVIWIVMAVLFRKKIKDCKIIIPLICIAIVPYIWYIAFAGHSGIHAWFTNKIQAMSLFAILSIYAETIEIKKITTRK